MEPTGGLDIVCDGQHQFFTRHQQVFGTAFGFFQFSAVVVAASDVPPYQDQEENSQNHGDNGDSCHCADRALADVFLLYMFVFVPEPALSSSMVLNS